MRDDPYFSIVLATYNRGQHIVPTIESVLRQTFSDYELIVVGDGCDDDTEQAVAAFPSERISWQNLPCNSGSQSFPNNQGIRRARGKWICYVGHDDVWMPDHLSQLRALMKRDRAADFAVSGCIYHGPPGSEAYFVTGQFSDSSAVFEHFLPPSAFAHRRDVVERIGFWRDPRAISAPVDAEFVLRAAHAGLRFVSTGCVTVHKFAAGHRYLSYLRPAADEQWAMLRAFDHGDGDVTRLIEQSKRAGWYMAMRHPDFSRYANGQLYDYNRTNKGLKRPPLRPLVQRVVVEQSDEPRALDWHGLEHGSRPFRWSGPNPCPKILVPFTGEHACVAIQIVVLPPAARPEDISVLVEERKVDHTTEQEADGTLWLRFVAPLSRSDYTIVNLHTPFMFCLRSAGGDDDRRRLGVAMADMTIEPAS